MIIKERKVPLSIQTREALLRRLPPNHPKRPEIKEDLKIAQAGYNGELNLDYHLAFLPEKDYRIFHDLRLFHQSLFSSIR